MQYFANRWPPLPVSSLSLSLEARSCLRLRRHIICKQCDQIGQFIRLWAAFKSLWHQLICPNLQHSQAIIVKVSKSIIFLVQSFLGNLLDIWQFFSGHSVSKPNSEQMVLWLPLIQVSEPIDSVWSEEATVVLFYLENATSGQGICSSSYSHFTACHFVKELLILVTYAYESISVE